jgi:hypothetical protein
MRCHVPATPSTQKAVDVPFDPFFFLVSATRELSEAVATAQDPLSPTTVWKCVVGSKGSRLNEGLESPDF